MMRSESHKLVYYIGQEEGELYDLTVDPHELDNLWDVPEHVALKNELFKHLLAWLAGSTYWNAGYRQKRERHYGMRWPSDGDAHLHGAKVAERDRQSTSLG